MSMRPVQPPHDLTDDWPDDPANDDLSRLASDLLECRLELPAIALDRIHVRVRQQMARRARRRKQATGVAVVIACLALGVGAYRWLRTPGAVLNAPATTGAADTTPVVRDEFEVTLPPAAPRTPGRPLIDLSKDASLFGERELRK